MVRLLCLAIVALGLWAGSAQGETLRFAPRPDDLPYRETWAVIVGTDTYESPALPKLSTPVRDADDFQRLLIDDFSIPPGNIRSVADAKFLEIETALQWLESRSCQEEDSVIVFLTGHGFERPVNGVNKAFLAASDSKVGDQEDLATCLDTDDLKRRMGRLKCRHKLLILDACYAGGAFRNGVLKDPIDQTRPAAAKPEAASTSQLNQRHGEATLRSYRRGEAFYLFTAGHQGPVNAVGPNGRNSPFASALFDQLRRRADTRLPYHTFRVRDLEKPVYDAVYSSTGRVQSPRLDRLEPGDGEFLFFPHWPDSRATPTEANQRDEIGTTVGRGIDALDSGNSFLALQEFSAAAELAREAGEPTDDHYLRIATTYALSPRLRHVFIHPKHPVRFALHHPSKGLVATFADDGIRIWETVRGREVDHLETESAEAGSTIVSAEFSSNGHWLATGHSDGSARLWNTLNWQPMQVLRHASESPAPTRVVHFNRAGTRLLTGTGMEARVWDVGNGAQIGRTVAAPPPGLFWDFALSESGLEVAAIWGGINSNGDSDARGIKLFELNNESPARSLDFSQRVRAVTLRPDVKVLAAFIEPQKIRFFDFKNGAEFAGPIDVDGSADNLRYSPDGRFLTIQANGGGGSNFYQFSGVTWKTPEKWPLVIPEIIGQWASSAQRETVGVSNGFATLWDRASQLRPAIEFTPKVDEGWRAIRSEFSSDGKTLSLDVLVSTDADNPPITRNALLDSAFFRLAIRYDTASGLAKSSATAQEFGSQWTSRGHLVSVDDTQAIRTYRIGEGSKATVITLPEEMGFGSVVEVSSDGRRALLSFSRKGPTRFEVWDLIQGKPIGTPLVIPQDHLTLCHLSPDGKRLLVYFFKPAGFEKPTGFETKLYNPETGGFVGESIRAGLYSFAPDSRSLAGQSGPSIQLYDTVTGLPRGEPLLHPKAKILSLAFSPDSDLLATGADDSTIRMWRVADAKRFTKPAVGEGEEDQVSLSHASGVTGLYFSPDGTLLASVTRDEGVQISESLTGNILSPLLTHEGMVHHVAFSPTGSRIATVGQDQKVRLWQLGWPEFVPPTAMKDHRTVANLVRLISAANGLNDEVAPAEALRLRQTLGTAAPALFRTTPEHQVSWHLQAAGEAEQRLQWDLALAQDDAMVAVEPRNARWHAARAGNLYNLQRTDEALRAAEAALRLNPRLTSASLTLGLALLFPAFTGKASYEEPVFRRAEEALTAAMEPEPQWLPYLMRGYARTGAKSFSKAAEDYEAALAATPPATWRRYAMIQLARSYGEAGDWKNAVTAYERAVEFCRNDKAIELHRAMISAGANLPDAAPVLQQVLAAGDDDLPMQIEAAIACLAAGERQKFREVRSDLVKRYWNSPKIPDRFRVAELFELEFADADQKEVMHIRAGMNLVDWTKVAQDFARERASLEVMLAGVTALNLRLNLANDNAAALRKIVDAPAADNMLVNYSGLMPARWYFWRALAAQKLGNLPQAKVEYEAGLKHYQDRIDAAPWWERFQAQRLELEVAQGFAEK